MFNFSFISILISLMIIVILIIIIVIAYKQGENNGKLTQDELNTAGQKTFKKQSRSVLGGKISEQIAPFLGGFSQAGLKPSEARFMGSPIDFLVFKGMDEKTITEIVFVEVKSGNSKLSPLEKELKKAIDEGRVSWKECRIEEEITKIPKEELL